VNPIPRRKKPIPENTNRKKVLVLEDEPVITRILTRTLSLEGMEVDSAENGLMAKDKLASGMGYDLFLFDIRTPIVNGIQVYKYLEDHYPAAASKVVFMTGDCLNAATSRFLERVKRPVLEKPFTPIELLEFINRVMPPEPTPV
jgi:DNA-binding response OmpR family regulator